MLLGVYSGIGGCGSLLNIKVSEWFRKGLEIAATTVKCSGPEGEIVKRDISSLGNPIQRFRRVVFPLLLKTSINKRHRFDPKKAGEERYSSRWVQK